MKTPSIKVTDLELMILQRIWESGESMTVNQIVDSWPEPKKPGYTTVLKTLQKMEAKSLVDHQAVGRKYAYFPLVSKEKVAQRRLTTIIDRMFSGDKISFAHYFIAASDFNGDELNELKALIAQVEKEDKAP